MKNKAIFLFLITIFSSSINAMDNPPESYLAKQAKDRYKQFPPRSVRLFANDISEYTHQAIGPYSLPYSNYLDDFVNFMEQKLSALIERAETEKFELDHIEGAKRTLTELKNTIAHKIKNDKLCPFDPLKHLPKKEVIIPIQTQKKYFTYRPTLKHIGIGAIALWTSAELYNAYQSIKPSECKNARYLKPMLLATRTAKNILSRPIQILDILEKKITKKIQSDVDRFLETYEASQKSDEPGS